jgi:hypothetical protein
MAALDAEDHLDCDPYLNPFLYDPECVNLFERVLRYEEMEEEEGDGGGGKGEGGEARRRDRGRTRVPRGEGC